MPADWQRRATGGSGRKAAGSPDSGSRNGAAGAGVRGGAARRNGARDRGNPGVLSDAALPASDAVVRDPLAAYARLGLGRPPQTASRFGTSTQTGSAGDQHRQSDHGWDRQDALRAAIGRGAEEPGIR